MSGFWMILDQTISSFRRGTITWVMQGMASIGEFWFPTEGPDTTCESKLLLAWGELLSVFAPGRKSITEGSFHWSFFRPATREELFNLRHSSLRNVIERTFGVFKHRFKILTQASEYRLEQQYDTVIACACIHNMNIVCNGTANHIFEEAESIFRNQARGSINAYSDDVYPAQQLLNDRQREECENWRDSIAEDMWQQYLFTLSSRANQPLESWSFFVSSFSHLWLLLLCMSPRNIRKSELAIQNTVISSIHLLSWMS